MAAILVGIGPRTADVTRTLLVARGSSPGGGTPVNLLQHFMAIWDECVGILLGRPLTGKIVALFAGLAAIGMLSANIVLSAFPDIDQELGVSAHELGLTLASFFIIFALAGDALLFSGTAPPNLWWYALSMTAFLCGMGLTNPLCTAIAMRPFGQEAGLASAPPNPLNTAITMRSRLNSLTRKE